MQDFGNISIPSKNPRKEKQESGNVLVDPPKTRHTSQRASKAYVRSHKYSILVLLICSLVTWIYYIPPNSPIAVFAFIILLTSILSIITSHFGKKTHVFSTLFILIFLVMSYSIGFDIINTIVLLSFIIGLSTLFKIKQN